MSDTASKEELIKSLQIYIDTQALDKLESQGVLKRKGSTTWYYVLKPNEVPHAIACIPSQIERRENGSRKTELWKFPTAAEIKRSRNLLAKLTGKPRT